MLHIGPHPISMVLQPRLRAEESEISTTPKVCGKDFYVFYCCIQRRHSDFLRHRGLALLVDYNRNCSCQLPAEKKRLECLSRSQCVPSLM